MDIFKALLFPFAVLYDLFTRIRNHLFNIGQKRSFRFQTMVIGVGNLSVGGSGKTPMVEYILRLLQPNFHVATLSRGYGRRTKGIRFAGEGENASTLGDEPFQLERKFGPQVKIIVGEERAVAIPEILHRFPETDVIVLDDAFQHRAVEPQLSILLTTYSHPFYRDFVLPMGRLRESRKEASRADLIVVTKCPMSLNEDVLEGVKKSVQQYSGEKPVYFSGLAYDTPVAFHSGYDFNRDVILVSGIANADLFEGYALTKYIVLHHFKFGDHHDFTPADLNSMVQFYKAQKPESVLLTTEKDMARLVSLPSWPTFDSLPWFFLPIKIQFLKNGPDFDKIVLQSVEKTIKAHW